MGASTSDMKYRKSVTVTDTSSNGGRKSTNEISTGIRHNLFPRVTHAERTAGVTRYRKFFMCNENTDDDIAYDAFIYFEFPSNGGDRFYLGAGTQVDNQGDLEDYDPVWMGVGQLNSNLSGGETTIDLAMENNDFQFPNGGYLHITNKFMTGQTIDSDVEIGDSIEISGGTWYTIAATEDVTYPKGLYVGSNVVLTLQSGTTNEEWLLLAENEYADEDIGDGNGINTSPTLTALAHATNGICRQPNYLPVVTATCGGVARTVNVASDGTCSGYCSAGELNMADGTWTTDITWNTAPDNATDITITYYENCFNYAGNVATVELESGEQVANAYTTSNSYGAGSINAGDIEPSSSAWTETSAAGTYDEATYPVVMYNDGTEYDTWTITFTSATNFTCTGTNEGSVGTGNIGGDFSPTNADTGQPYFTIDKDGWGGIWASGDTVTFTTSPAAIPIWIKEVVPASTAAVNNNILPLGAYWE